MISRSLKETFYRTMSVPMRMNGWMWRTFRTPKPGGSSVSASGNGPVKVHLGPGQEKYLPGWVNVDANLFTAKIDLWADLRNPLPFRDATVDAFYSHHMIEHLPNERLLFHFREMFRCLKPGGALRVGGPDAENAARKFAEGDINWFGDFPDKHESIGGKYHNFIYCRGEHLTALSLSYLQEVATQAGFTNVVRCAPVTDTKHPDLFAEVLGKEFEMTPEVPHTLLVEADKPRS